MNGFLQVYLGAAPGVGKTFAMLEEGKRLAALGKDVVVGLVETHGRVETARMAEGLEILPRATVAHREVELAELDLDALLARAPEWALVDELAHSNAPGLRNDKRWADVQTLLDAGINVISTVNIQHIESLNDVVQSITGVVQRETIPDSVLRGADQIEVVDLAPEALRSRLSDGQIYPAGTIDAALSNYFRLGNLTALRELALLWLADEVDVALQAYRSAHGIQNKWEARERVVVALPGGAEGDTLIRRGARIAARSGGGQLFAVHVASSDGLAEPNPGALLAQRTLVESLGGTYHQVVGHSTPATLVEFARGVNATQLVIGVSRRSRLTAFLTGQGIGATVIRASGDVDVHIVSHASAGTLQLPRSRGSVTARRMVSGFAVALLGLPLLTWLLTTFRTGDSLPSDVLAYQLLVVIVALIGGIWPAATAALLAGLLLDYFFVAPLYTVTIASPLHLLALLIFLVIAILVSLVVDQAASRSRAAKRSGAEAETLATVAGSIIRGENALDVLTNRLREVFGMALVTIARNGVVLNSSGEMPSTGDRLRSSANPAPFTVERLNKDSELTLFGREVPADDRRILDAFISQIQSALEQDELRVTAEALRPLEQADRLRTALLRAVGHDLRTPLSSATAAVSSLRSTDVVWSESDRAELLTTAEVSLHRLSELVNDLLDASRLQAGVLPISLADVGLDDIVPLALDELDAGSDQVEVRVPDSLPEAHCDAALVQRVIVNLVSNALRYSPAGSPVIVSASSFGDRLEVRITDRGPGIPQSKLAEAFQPFQRLGDTDNTTGVGLGLALSKGFMEAMGGALEAEDTPGGGLTMVMTLSASTSRQPDLTPEVL